jgi:hypothetical protein
MKRARRVTAVLLPTLLLAGCAGSDPLGSELTTAAQESAGGTFELADLGAADGSSFLVVCPYESTDSVHERLGFTWPDAPDYAQDDGHQTIALLDDGRVRSSTELPRDAVDFCSVGGWEVLATSAVLEVSDAADPLTVTRSETRTR